MNMKCYCKSITVVLQRPTIRLHHFIFFNLNFGKVLLPLPH